MTTNLEPEKTLAKGIQGGKVLATKAEGERCIKPYAVSVEKIVKSPLNQPAIDPSFAASVLKKTAAESTREGFKTEAHEDPILKGETSLDHKTTNNLRQLTEN